MTPARSLLPCSPTRALAVVAAIGATRAAGFFIPIFNSDEAYLATTAEVLRAGGRLYLDVADRKPPLVPWIYRALFEVSGGPSLVVVHVAAILALAVTAAVLAAFAWRTLEPAQPGATRAAVALFVVAQAAGPPAETLAANFEVFMLPLYAGALLSVRRERTWADALSGALLAAAILAKQPAALGGAALAVCVATRATWRARLAGGAAGLAGAAAVLGAAALAIGPDAAPAAWFWMLSGQGGYLGGVAVTTVAGRLAAGTLGFLVPNGVLAAGLLRARADDLDPATRRLLWTFLAASMVGVSVGFRFFGHYFLQLLPAACLLAAPAVARWLSGPRRALVTGALVLPALAAAVVGFWGPEVTGMPRYRILAEAVAARTAPADRVLVWGHFPELLWAARGLPATRLIPTGFLTGASGGREPGPATLAHGSPAAWEMFFADLERHPPALVVDTSPARLRDYEHYPISLFPRLEAWLHASYVPVATVEGYVLHARIDAPSGR